MPRRHRKMRKGGFLGFGESDSTTYGSTDSGSGMFGSVGDTLSGWGSSISNTASSAWEKTKNATSSAYDSATGQSSTLGGRRSKKMRGGVAGNTPTTGLATRASPISNIKTAQPNNLVGGANMPATMGVAKPMTTGTSNPMTGAANGAAKPASASQHKMSGGRTRKHRRHSRRHHKHSKSCRHRKH